MAAGGSDRTVLIALATNGAIACAKAAAAVWSGSSAMLSEAIHSTAAYSNQALMYFGQKRAQRGADPQRPFGHAKEIYFWSFVVAVLVFAIGAGVSINEGVHQLADPRPIRDAAINYVVLGGAFAFKTYVLVVGYRELSRRNRRGFSSASLRASRDPSSATVLAEGAAGLVGLAIALAGVLLADVFGWLRADGAASIAIGLVMAYVAASFAIQVKGLLVDAGATTDVRDGIRDIILADIDRHG
ncbi:MAG: cation diffusion facilitator family transporter, partial [Pseudomonadota bacterium]